MHTVQPNTFISVNLTNISLQHIFSLKHHFTKLSSHPSSSEVFTVLLLVRSFWTSKSIVSSIFACVRYFCWFDHFGPAKVSSVRFLHVNDTFAGPIVFDQQKYRQFDFFIGLQTRSYRTRKNNFCIGLTDWAMILSIDVDVVMKR